MSPGEVLRGETEMVEVDGDSLGLELSQHIWRGQTKHLRGEQVETPGGVENDKDKDKNKDKDTSG